VSFSSHVTLGPTFLFRQGLSTETQHYVRESCSDFLRDEVSCSTSDETNPVGGAQMMLGLSAAVELGG
jgi:hypothetical protein